MTARDIFLALALVATLVLGLSIQGGACGPSDLEMRVRASEPIKL